MQQIVIAKDLLITSSTEVIKAMFGMSRKNLLSSKGKTFQYKQIKGYKSAFDSNEFTKIVDPYNRLRELIHKK